MDTNFEKSTIYKKALKEYQEKVYGEILKPLHIIVIDNDEVNLFYNQTIVNDIFTQLKDIYNKSHDWDDVTNFPISLWYEEPWISEITFMWNKYKVISLWYDNCDIPSQFKAKL